LDSIRRALADIEERLSSLEASGRYDEDEDLVDDDDLEGPSDDPDQGLGRHDIDMDAGPSRRRPLGVGLEADDPRMGPRDPRSRFIDRFRRDYNNKVERDGIYGGDIAAYADARGIKGASPEETAEKTISRYRRHMGG
jgi:hypothetical protein